MVDLHTQSSSQLRSLSRSRRGREPAREWTYRTKLMCTPKDRWMPAQFRQMKTPYGTEAQVGFLLGQSKHTCKDSPFRHARSATAFPHLPSRPGTPASNPAYACNLPCSPALPAAS